MNNLTIPEAVISDAFNTFKVSYFCVSYFKNKTKKSVSHNQLKDRVLCFSNQYTSHQCRHFLCYLQAYLLALM